MKPPLLCCDISFLSVKLLELEDVGLIESDPARYTSCSASIVYLHSSRENLPGVEQSPQKEPRMAGFTSRPPVWKVREHERRRREFFAV